MLIEAQSMMVLSIIKIKYQYLGSLGGKASKADKLLIVNEKHYAKLEATFA
jgi:hypothetical protein